MVQARGQQVTLVIGELLAESRSSTMDSAAGAGWPEDSSQVMYLHYAIVLV